MKKIAYQGIEGAFSFVTALQKFGEDNYFIGLPTFKDVFKSIAEGRVEFGVVPVENSLTGSIYENYDLLNTYNMQIVGEHFTRINLSLLVFPQSNQQKEERLKNIKKVFSHQKALEQCSCFFTKYPWMEPVIYSNTAAAAIDVASLQDPTCAAIASAQAGKTYELEILEDAIEDNPMNYTRFIIVSQKEPLNDQADKCSLVVQLKNTPGALAKMLANLEELGVNLTKIESRPLRGTSFEYLFYIDFEFVRENREAVEDLLKRLGSHVQTLKILGFYQKGILWTS